MALLSPTILMTLPTATAAAKKSTKPAGKSLIDAIEKGHESRVLKLLKKQSTLINVRNSDQMTPLMIAIHQKNIKIVKALLNLPHLSINAKDAANQTALMHATLAGHEPIITALLNHPNININAVDNLKKTALMHAATNGKTHIVSQLLQHDHSAINYQDKYGNTALILAISKKNTRTVAAILNETSVNVMLENKIGFNALTYASYIGAATILSEILKNPHADLSAKDANGKTALELAITTSKTDVFFLIAYKITSDLFEIFTDLSIGKKPPEKKNANIISTIKNVLELKPKNNKEKALINILSISVLLPLLIPLLIPLSLFLLTIGSIKLLYNYLNSRNARRAPIVADAPVAPHDADAGNNAHHIEMYKTYNDVAEIWNKSFGAQLETNVEPDVLKKITRFLRAENDSFYNLFTFNYKKKKADADAVANRIYDLIKNLDKKNHLRIEENFKKSLTRMQLNTETINALLEVVSLISFYCKANKNPEYTQAFIHLGTPYGLTNAHISDFFKHPIHGMIQPVLQEGLRRYIYTLHHGKEPPVISPEEQIKAMIDFQTKIAP